MPPGTLSRPGSARKDGELAGPSGDPTPRDDPGAPGPDRAHYQPPTGQVGDRVVAPARGVAGLLRQERARSAVARHAEIGRILAGHDSREDRRAEQNRQR
jgi:hypothetical protein